jgi:hypothetical protein
MTQGSYVSCLLESAQTLGYPPGKLPLPTRAQKIPVWLPASRIR